MTPPRECWVVVDVDGRPVHAEGTEDGAVEEVAMYDACQFEFAPHEAVRMVAAGVVECSQDEFDALMLCLAAAMDTAVRDDDTHLSRSIDAMRAFLARMVVRP